MTITLLVKNYFAGEPTQRFTGPHFSARVAAGPGEKEHSLAGRALRPGHQDSPDLMVHALHKLCSTLKGLRVCTNGEPQLEENIKQ